MTADLAALARKLREDSRRAQGLPADADDATRAAVSAVLALAPVREVARHAEAA